MREEPAGTLSGGLFAWGQTPMTVGTIIGRRR